MMGIAIEVVDRDGGLGALLAKLQGRGLRTTRQPHITIVHGRSVPIPHLDRAWSWLRDLGLRMRHAFDRSPSSSSAQSDGSLRTNVVSGAMRSKRLERTLLLVVLVIVPANALGRSATSRTETCPAPRMRGRAGQLFGSFGIVDTSQASQRRHVPCK